MLTEWKDSFWQSVYWLNIKIELSKMYHDVLHWKHTNCGFCLFVETSFCLLRIESHFKILMRVELWDKNEDNI